MDRKTVIIIGSGLGGLTTGVVLAKNGYRVTVLEQNPVPGGCLQCFTRRGVKFETGMHFVGSADEGQILNRMMRYLEIADRVELSRLDPRSAWPTTSPPSVTTCLATVAWWTASPPPRRCIR